MKILFYGVNELLLRLICHTTSEAVFRLHEDTYILSFRMGVLLVTFYG